MADLFRGEYGKVLYIETGFDLSSATNIELHFSAPTGGIHFVNSTSVSTSATAVTTSACGVFSANKYVTYTITQGDFSFSTSTGAAAYKNPWKGWLEVDWGSTKHLISSTFLFDVINPGD